MRGIRADQPGASRRRIRPQISAHVSRGAAQRSQTRDLQMREILTDAAPVTKHFFRRSPHVGGFGIEAKILMNPRGQIQ